MKRQKSPVFLVFLAVCIFFSGCASMFEHSYLVISEHEDDYVDIHDDESVQNVRNYTSMKNALLNLVNSASEAGVITTKNYAGNVPEDISKACLEVTRETPMGVFAVDYMTHDAAQILSYYEIDVYIKYKRSEEEIDSVVSVNSGPALQELIKNTLQTFQPTLYALMVSTAITEDEIIEFVQSYYRQNPALLPELPELTIDAYPSIDAVQRILAIHFDYSMSITALEEMQSALQDAAENFVSDMEQTDSAHTALALCQQMQTLCQTSGIGNRAADILLNGIGNSEGYAMAFKLFCDLLNIECTVVEGRMDGETHFWTIIRLDEDYYHVDPYIFDAENATSAFLMDDRGMLGRYWWDTENYPVWSGKLRYESIAGPPDSAGYASPSPSPIQADNWAEAPAS